MWNANSMTVDFQEEDESWEVKAFAEDTGNAMGTTWPPRSYTCTFCRREFRSAQALGGHMNVHRRDRARLHQAQPNLKNPNSSSTPSSLLIPTEEVATDGGLCLLFSLPKPNVIFKPSSLNNVNGSPSYLHSITSHPNTSNFNFPLVVAPQSLNYSLSNSSKNEAPTSIDLKSNHVFVPDNMIKKTELAVEGIDLELRLGCSSSAS